MDTYSARGVAERRLLEAIEEHENVSRRPGENRLWANDRMTALRRRAADWAAILDTLRGPD